MQGHKPVAGHEAKYSVTSDGRIYSIASRMYLDPAVNHNGYEKVMFRKGGKSKSLFVHRLVAIAFIGEQPFENAQVNHKDGNKRNNDASNLEWVTPRQNVLDAVARTSKIKRMVAKAA